MSLNYKQTKSKKVKRYIAQVRKPYLSTRFVKIQYCLKIIQNKTTTTNQQH